MNLVAITKAALGVGFSVANSIVVPCSFNRVGGTAESEYDTATGVVTPNTLTVSPVAAMILSFSAREIDGERVRSGDERVIVRTAELGALSEPARDDYLIEVGGGQRRDVIEFRADPTRTFWILHCRRNSG